MRECFFTKEQLQKMRIPKFITNVFKKDPKLTPVGLEKALKECLITEEEYHRLKVLRHEKELKDLQKKSK